MYKSMVVKLVLLNSLLALSGCSRTCEVDDKKDKEDKQLADKGAERPSCHGSSHRGGSHGIGHFFYWGGGGGRAGGGGSVGQPGAGNVGRGGFGATRGGSVMKRHTCPPRPNWKERVESLGFAFHSVPDLYWDESAYYEFNAAQIDVLEKAANDVHALCLQSVEHILREDLLARFQIPPEWASYVKQSWDADEPTLYGRFDFGYDGAGPPKLLEYNADTPTALLEAAVIQWHWLQDIEPAADQFNSIHEHLIAAWKFLAKDIDTLYLTGLSDNLEDEITVFYMRDTAVQAGLKTLSLPIDRVGWDHVQKRFVDGNNRPIRHLFKLYPWEWLMHEEFGRFILLRTTAWYEPAWKMLLSNKAILPILWELFPGHPNLLRAELEPFGGSYIRKPCLGREGANVQVVFDGQEFMKTDGDYGAPYVYQDIFPLPKFDGNFPVLGCWIVGDEACGMGIRESTDLIMRNTSRFVPHLFRPR